MKNGFNVKAEGGIWDGPQDVPPIGIKPGFDGPRSTLPGG
jgi:hypothetical protein